MAFVLAMSQGGGDHDGKLESYSVPATHATLLAPGDVVVVTGESNTKGRAEADAAAAGAAITGVIAGISPQLKNRKPCRDWITSIYRGQYYGSRCPRA